MDEAQKKYLSENATFTTTMFGGVLYFTKDGIWFDGSEDDFQRLKGAVGTPQDTSHSEKT